MGFQWGSGAATPTAPLTKTGGGSGFTWGGGSSAAPLGIPNDTPTVTTTKASAPTKPASLFGKVSNFVKNDIIKPTVTTGEKAINTVGAGATGLVGGAKVGADLLTGHKAAAYSTVQKTNAKMDELLSKGNGGAGGYLTPQQAASSGGGTKGLVKNIVKPIAQGVTDIAPLVLPVGKAAEGASLLARAGRSAVENAAVGAGTTAANQALNGKVNLKDVLKGAAYGGALGAGGSLLHEGVKTGANTAKEKLPIGTTAEAKTLVRNQATISLLDKARTAQPPDIKAKLDPQKVQEGLIKPDIKETSTSSLVLGAEAAGKKIDAGKVAQYVKQIKDGEPIEPVITHTVNGQTVVIDGQHRVAAAQKLGIETVPTVEKGSGVVTKEPALTAHTATTAPPEVSVVAPPRTAPETAGTRSKSAASSQFTTKPSEPLTPVQTAHMETVNGYTHSRHLEKDYADMLRQQEQTATGGQKVADGVGGYKRTSEHSQFYRDYYAENKRAPSKEAYLAEAQRQLKSGHAAFEASQDYKTLVEREHQPIPQQPINIKPIVSNGPTLKSKLGVGVEEKAVQAKLVKDLGDLPEYSKVNMKDQAKSVTDLMQNDEQKAINIALGHEAPPANILPESVFTAVELKAQATGDVDLLRQLAHSTRVGEATVMGQRLRALAERNPDSAVGAIKSIQEARSQAAETKLGKSVDKAISENVRAAKASIPKVTKETWSDFISSIKC